MLVFGDTPSWLDYGRSLARGRGFALSTNDKSALAAKLGEIANAIPVALVR